MRAAAIASVLLLGCTATIPEGRLGCTTDSDCPPDWSCSAGRCYEGAGPPDTDAGGGVDAGAMDAGAMDAGGTDAGAMDAGDTDAGAMDAGDTDAGDTDAGDTDAGAADGGVDGGGSIAVTMLSVGGFHACAVAGGTLHCWGGNLVGQVGDGTTFDRFDPVPLDPGGGVSEISAGFGGTCVELVGGRARCWGANDDGQNSDGTMTHPQTRPVDVDTTWGSMGVREVNHGWSHSCFVTDDGAVWCSGSAAFGALGDRTEDVYSPIRLFATELPSVTTLDAYGPTCVIDASDRVQCWGENTNGELGDGTTDARTTPVLTTGLSGAFAEVHAGAFHVCARSATGAVFCWGHNPEGETGDGTTDTPRTTPVATGITDAVQLTVGHQHSCALRTGGAVFCWGRNDNGEIGDGSMMHRLSPTRAMLPRPAVAVSAGRFFTCAILDDATLWCWGINSEGQLAQGAASGPQPVPLQVTGWTP